MANSFAELKNIVSETLYVKYVAERLAFILKLLAPLCKVLRCLNERIIRSFSHLANGLLLIRKTASEDYLNSFPTTWYKLMSSAGLSSPNILKIIVFITI